MKGEARHPGSHPVGRSPGRSAAEPDLVPVGIAVGGLAHAVGVGLTPAALIYQHTAMERDPAIADALGKLATEALNKQDQDGSGT
ncbi:MAG: Site-specific recombinase XerD [Sphaerisporangium sp.]|nr:Site-specific recombinase XerD [Sphaerisporangium sp.]